MPYTQVPQNSGSNSSTDAIIFPTDQLRQVAAQILVDADAALQRHNAIWAKIQTFLHDHDDGGHMAAVLNPHEQRMRASYNWQMQLASALFQAIDTVEGTDNAMAQGFTHSYHGFQP
ncbi:MAG TPA: hypothetical protein VFB60_01570 [Ktedonobacteraceae bacterium]|nr:hypothetical protein [Ktedonobacteraceae bacterium]